MDSESKNDFVLGEQKFRHYCMEFLKHSQNIGDGWEWKSLQGSDEGYLSKTCYQTRSIGKEISHLKEGDDDQPSSTSMEDFHKEEKEDSVFPQSPQESEVTHYEYHVLYSVSYQAPELYFRASFLDGRPLTLEEIWDRVHDCFKPRLLHGPWETITQKTPNPDLDIPSTPDLSLIAESEGIVSTTYVPITPKDTVLKGKTHKKKKKEDNILKKAEEAYKSSDHFDHLATCMMDTDMQVEFESIVADLIFQGRRRLRTSDTCLMRPAPLPLPPV
ncbi:ubiquitin-like-conjugating enzyme ATG10 isoform X1 [Pseudophryne corroboree]|uniref:ubiquitin-like-conjugating enzyme ATG10 isoform X1 n=1 Tax=Pseudophryne corroboree TaxID=495146 RepID=UPI003081ACDF